MQRDAPSPRRTEVPGILPDARSRLIGAAFVPVEHVRGPACEHRLPGGACGTAVFSSCRVIMLRAPAGGHLTLSSPGQWRKGTARDRR
jgi:hypothetical protein